MAKVSVFLLSLGVCGLSAAAGSQLSPMTRRSLNTTDPDMNCCLEMRPMCGGGDTVGEVDVEKCTQTIVDNEWSDGRTTALRVVPGFGAFLSLCGSIFIIFTWGYFTKMRRNAAYQLIVMMSICDLMAAFSYLLGLASNPGTQVCHASPSSLCMAQATMSQFFETASFFWILCIAYNIYAILVRQEEASSTSQKHRMRYYHAVSWGVPLLLLLGAWSGLGDAGNWCWIKKKYQTQRVLCYYFWLIAIMCINLYLISAVMKYLKKSTGQHGNNTSAVILRLRLYVLAFVIMHIPSVINRVLNLFSCNDYFFFSLLQSIFEPMNGFVNAVVYGMNKMVFMQYREHFSVFKRSSTPPRDTEMTAPNQPDSNEAAEVADVQIEER